MNFLIDGYVESSGRSENEHRQKAYASYIEGIKHELPASAYDFAVAPWHYRHDDHRCPHDAWVEYLRIGESASGERKQNRQIQIDLRLLGAYHDGYLDLNYKDVRAYAVGAEPDAQGRAQSNHAGHGDWPVDEIRLSENNLVLHEIIFSNHGRWLIEASDILWEWKPLEPALG